MEFLASFHAGGVYGLLQDSEHQQDWESGALVRSQIIPSFFLYAWEIFSERENEFTTT